MRKVGIAVLIIVVVLVAAALIIPHVININNYHSQIQAQLEKRLGRTVTLGDMSLSLFPPSFKVNNAIIGEDPQFSTARAFATAEKLSVSVKFWPLLHKQVEVKSLELVRPHALNWCVIRREYGTLPHWGSRRSRQPDRTHRQPLRRRRRAQLRKQRGKNHSRRTRRKASRRRGSSRWRIWWSQTGRWRSRTSKSTNHARFTTILM